MNRKLLLGALIGAGISMDPLAEKFGISEQVVQVIEQQIPRP